MFNKKRKIHTRFEFDHKTISGSSNSQFNSEEGLLEGLRSRFEKFGPLVISSIYDNSIRYHTLETQSNKYQTNAEELVDSKLEEIKHILVEQFKEKEEHVLSHNGVPKGIFAEKEDAIAEKKKLVDRGISESEILITTLEVNKPV